MGSNGEKCKYQVAELYELQEEKKKLGEFKVDMSQEFMELSYRMTSVDMGEINKKLEGLTKIVQYMNNKFTKDLETMKKDSREKYQI